MRYLDGIFTKCGGGILLEIGIGQGEMQRCLRELPGYTYTGLDYNYGICNRLRAGNTNVNAALPFVPLKPQSVSVVYCSHVIEHLFDYKTALEFLNEAHRILKDHGVLILLFPDYASWKTDFFEIDYSHNFPMGSRRMFQMAIDTGFEVTKWIDYSGPFLGWKGRLFSGIGKIVPLNLLYNLNPVKFYGLKKSKYFLNRNFLFVLEKKGNDLSA